MGYVNHDKCWEYLVWSEAENTGAEANQDVAMRTTENTSLLESSNQQQESETESKEH